MEVGVLAWLLAPLSWLWGVLWYLLLRPWAVAVLIAVVSTAYLIFRHQKSRSQRSKPKSAPVVVTRQSVVIPTVLQVLPVHPNNGWVLTRVSNSLRVFTRTFPSLAPSTLPCAAASILIEVPPKKALSAAVNSKELTYWMEGVLSPPQHIKGDKDGDIVKVTLESPPKEDSPLTRAVFHTKRRFARFTEKYMPFLSGVVGDQVDLVIETLDRTWHVEEEGQCFVFSLPAEPSTLPYHWSVLVFSTLKEKVFSLATLIMLPRSKNSIHHTTSLITSRLNALREHIVLKKLKAYSTSQPNNPWSLHNSFLPPNLHLTSTNQNAAISTTAAPKIPNRPARQLTKQVKLSQQAARQEDSRSLKKQAPEHTKKEPNRTQKSSQYAATQRTGSPSNTTPPSPPGNPPDRPPHRVTSLATSDPALVSLDEKYISLTKQTCELLVNVANATEQDGWLVVGTTKNVFVMKKPPAKGAPPINCVKGTGIVRAPPEFVLRFLKDPAHTKQLDDLLKETNIAHEVSDAIHIVQLLYKPIWPTSPREFSVMSVSGQVDEHTWVQAGVSVQDPRIPEPKGYVRGDLIVGGYVVRSISDSPELSEVTYAVQTDLKGSIPSFAVNKVTESQPQCVNRLRNLVEPFYASMKTDPQRLREFEETFVIGQISPGVRQQKSPPPEPDQIVNPTPVPDNTSPDSFPSSSSVSEEQLSRVEGGEWAWQDKQDGELDKKPNTSEVLDKVGFEEDFRRNSSGFETPELVEESENATLDVLLGSEQQPLSSQPLPSIDFESVTGTKPGADGQDGSTTYLDEGGLIIMETLETYTPLELSSAPDSTGSEEGEEEGEMRVDKQGGGEDGEGEEKEEQEEGKEEKGKEAERKWERKGEEELRPEGRGEGEEGEKSVEEEEEEEEVFVKKRGPSLELKLPPYPREATREDTEDSESDWRLNSITKETINYPRSGSGMVDFRTMANQNAARVLEELFFVSNLDLSDPTTFLNQSNGWSFVDVEKDVIILKKKSADSPFLSFMGKGIINLPPQEVYDSLRNPQLRFTYDNMLKELHIVKQIEEGLYILHLHHETTQCFIKQSRDFCILVSERSEPKKKLLVGTSVEVPECPPNPNCVRGKIYCSGWVVEPCRIQGRLRTEITYILQVDMGGVPVTLVNFISKRQPLAIAYLRDYLVSTSLHVSNKEPTS